MKVESLRLESERMALEARISWEMVGAMERTGSSRVSIEEVAVEAAFWDREAVFARHGEERKALEHHLEKEL